jgi:hypothetical protein
VSHLLLPLLLAPLPLVLVLAVLTLPMVGCSGFNRSGPESLADIACRCHGHGYAPTAAASNRPPHITRTSNAAVTTFATLPASMLCDGRCCCYALLLLRQRRCGHPVAAARHHHTLVRAARSSRGGQGSSHCSEGQWSSRRRQALALALATTTPATVTATVIIQQPRVGERGRSGDAGGGVVRQHAGEEVDGARLATQRGDDLRGVACVRQGVWQRRRGVRGEAGYTRGSVVRCRV